MFKPDEHYYDAMRRMQAALHAAQELVRETDDPKVAEIVRELSNSVMLVVTPVMAAAVDEAWRRQQAAENN